MLMAKTDKTVPAGGGGIRRGGVGGTDARGMFVGGGGRD